MLQSVLNLPDIFGPASAMTHLRATCSACLLDTCTDAALRANPLFHQGLRDLLLSVFGDVPAVITCEERRLLFCMLPRSAVFIWVKEDGLKVCSGNCVGVLCAVCLRLYSRVAPSRTVMYLQVHSENCVMLLLSAWAEANPIGYGIQHWPPRTVLAGPPRRREGDYDDGFDEFSSDDDTDDDDSDDGDRDDDEEEDGGRPPPAVALGPRGDEAADEQRRLATVRAGPPIPGLAASRNEELAHYVRVSHLSPSYLQCIAPHTPWFAVRQGGGAVINK